MDSRAGRVLTEDRRSIFDDEEWAWIVAMSFERLRNLLEEIGSGKRGKPPATIVILSGDVHHAYLCEVGFPPGSGVDSGVYQAVCSPYRNPLDQNERRAIKVGFTRPFIAAMRGLAGSAGVPDPGIRWRLLEGPYFDNQVATLRLDGRKSVAQLDKTAPGEGEERHLECVFERRLS
jgi:hypothetical protein